MSPPESSSQKKILYAVLTAFVALFFEAAAGEFVLRQQRVAIEDSEKLEKGLFAYDSRLGWRLQGNWGGKHRHHDFAVAYQTGPDGFRGRFRPASDRTGPEHIAFFGDSFTFGFGAGPGQTFVALLDEADVYRAYLNFGVPGFASDQAVLLIEEIMPAHRPGTVLMVVHLGDDLADNMHPYPLRLDNGKPMFALSANDLILRNVPVSRERKPASEQGMDLEKSILAGSGVRPSFWKGLLGGSETTRRLGLEASARVDLSDHLQRSQVRPLALFQALALRGKAAAAAQGAGFGLVLLPGRGFVQDPDGIAAQYQDYLRRAIVAWGVEMAVPVADAAKQLRRRYRDGIAGDYYQNEGHLTAQGHRAVADFLRPWIDLRFGRGG